MLFASLFDKLYIFLTGESKSYTCYPNIFNVKLQNTEVICLSDYTELRSVILDAKYRQNAHAQKALARFCADFLSEFISENIQVYASKKIIISYIPRHWLKSALYGEDHMKQIAKKTERILKKRNFNTQFLQIIKRKKYTKSQYRLSKYERKENIKGAFKALSQNLSNSIIIIIDDILTSGASFKEAQLSLKTLKKQNNRIYLIAISCKNPGV